MSRKRSRAPERVGAKLKRARERHRISLRQVSDATKISVSVLQALERDDISYLPGGVVGRGFVRSFAAAVHLDPEAIVAEFVAQFPHESVNEGYRNAAGEERTFRDDPPSSGVKIRLHSASPFRVAAIVLVLAALPASLYLAIARPNALSMQTANQLIGVTSSTPDRALTVTKSVALPARMSAAKAPSLAALSLPPVDDSHTPIESSASTSGRTDAAGTASHQLKVTLSASAPSWVIASVDGRKTLSRLMESGETETLEGGRELVVTAGNGDAISMTLNGTPLGSLGRDSGSVTLRLNHENVDRYLRRAATESTRAQ